MADFRKYALALAGAACFLGITGTASAQLGTGFNCTANASTPLDMRAEGITEQAGDIVLNCTGGTPTAKGAVVPQVNITVSLNTQATSRLIGLIGNNNLTEALLLINEPQSGFQTLCPAGAAAGNVGTCGITTFGTGLGGGQGFGQYTGGVPNAYQGILVAPNAITFFGVPIDPPGAGNTNNGIISSLVLRVTDVRANASALGAPTGFSSTSVLASISTSVGFPITNPSLTVGNVRTGLLRGLYNGITVTSPVVSSVSNASATSFGTPGTSGAPTLTQCTSNSLSSTSISATLVEYVNFTEGFGTATKLRYALAGPGAEGTPGFISNAESQFLLNGSNASTTSNGNADFATRIKLTFGSVPSGVTVYVPVTVPDNVTVTPTGSSSAVPVEFLTLTGSESGSFSAVVPSTTTNLPSGVYGGFAPVTITAGSGVAVYEVTSQLSIAPSVIDSFSVPILVTYTAAPSTNSPGLGTSTVQVDFAPTSTVSVAASGPIPRFIQTSPLNNSFAIAACATNLLFPFISNQASFDTGIAIAATSQDPFGTALQSGTCTLNFYGAGAPAAFTTPTVTAGTVYTTLASSVAAGFQGYIIAQCKFQYAHGFAFITDGFGGPGLGRSQGYLALIIPDVSITSRKANFNASVTGGGEGLPN